MGNSESQFEGQFNSLYRFVGIVEDRLFGSVKIYRKNKFNFDYMMVLQRPLSDFIGKENGNPPVQYLNNRLQLIRKYQNGYTARLSFSKVIERTLKCEQPNVRLYLEYYNHTLSDYLIALRASKLSLTLDESMFVANSLAEGMMVLRKMEIRDFWINLQSVWVSVDQGNLVINPVYLIYETAAEGHRSKQVKQINNDFQPLDLAASHCHLHTPTFAKEPMDPYQHLQIQNIIEIYLEMTRYLQPRDLPGAKRLYKQMVDCRSLLELQSHLGSSCEELNVQQFAVNKEPTSLYARRSD